MDRAFCAFFRRVRDGQKPGYPRFKKQRRFKSFTYPDPAGWKLLESESGRPDRTHRLRITNLGEMRVRGRHRFPPGHYKPNDLTVFRRGKKWYASVTLRVEDAACWRRSRRERPGSGARERGFDLGLESLLTFDDGEVIENPR